MSELICARTYGTKEEAELAKGILESNGIHAAVSADDVGGWTHPWNFQVELQVMETDLEEAQQILDYYHKEA